MATRPGALAALLALGASLALAAPAAADVCLGPGPGVAVMVNGTLVGPVGVPGASAPMPLVDVRVNCPA